MPPIAAITFARAERAIGAGRPSFANMPPGRGEVSENRNSQLSVVARASRPLSSALKRATQSHTAAIGVAWISAVPTSPSSVRTSTTIRCAFWWHSWAV